MPENNLEQKIDEQIAYTLAAPANLRIRGIPGSVNTMIPHVEGQKQGYSFTVYFTPNPAWAFIRWIAVPNNAYDNSQSWDSLVNSTSPRVEIEHIHHNGIPTGEAIINVKTNEALTLIPYCIERPYVVTTNLPGNFMNRLVTNYPIQIWFNREIDPASLTFDNFIISAETNQGFGGRILEGSEITQYYNAPAANGRQIVISRNFTANQSVFGNLNITVRLNLGGIFDAEHKVSMGQPGQFRDLYYGVSFRSYRQAPETENLEANTVSTGSDISLFPGKRDFTGENKDRSNIRTLDNSIEHVFTSLGHVRITENREGSNQYPYAIYGFSTAHSGPHFAELAKTYREIHSDREIHGGENEPYIVRHVLRTTTDGIIQLAVQPTDTLGNFDNFERAQKVRVILDTTPPGQVINLTGVYDSAEEKLTFTWWNPVDIDFAGIRIYYGQELRTFLPDKTPNVERSIVRTVDIIGNVSAPFDFVLTHALRPVINSLQPGGGTFENQVTLQVSASVGDGGTLSYQ
jgi:hypothetical protein